jgi:thiol-disulfide isomerase/thioredoxin
VDRGEFLGLLALALGAGAVPAPPISPSPSPASASKWDSCTVNPVLPYNRPIELKMRVLDGPDFDLLRYRGKAVLLNIFATWCGPCNHEMPHIVEAAADYAPRGLAVIGIDSNEEDDTVRAFRRRYGIGFPIAMDATGGFVNALESGDSNTNLIYPVTLFIAPNGYLYCDLVGSVGRSELRYRIEHFLAASASLIAPTPSPSPSASPQQAEPAPLFWGSS